MDFINSLSRVDDYIHRDIPRQDEDEHAASLGSVGHSPQLSTGYDQLQHRSSTADELNVGNFQMRPYNTWAESTHNTAVENTTVTKPQNDEALLRLKEQFSPHIRWTTPSPNLRPGVKKTMDTFMIPGVVVETSWKRYFLGTAPGVCALPHHRSVPAPLSPLFDFIQYTLRGISMSTFCSNPWTGLLLLVGTFLHSSAVGTMGLLGVVMSTLFAILMGFPFVLVRSGVFGFNGFLTGAMMATLDLSGVDGPNPALILPVMMMASLSSVLMASLGNFLIPHHGIAPVGTPFCIAGLVWVAASYHFNYFPVVAFPNALSPQSVERNVEVYDWQVLGELILRGMGQFCWSNKVEVGVIAFVGIGLTSRISALMALFGSVLAVATGLALGAPETTMCVPVTCGVWALNSQLTMLALGGNFYVMSIRCFIFSSFAAILATIGNAAVMAVFAPFGLPSLTVSFVSISMVCQIMGKTSSTLTYVPLESVTYPEEHMVRFSMSKEVLHIFHSVIVTATRPEKTDASGASATGDAMEMSLLKVSKLSNADKQRIEKTFDSIQDCEDGTVSLEAFAKTLLDCGYCISPRILSFLYHETDVNKDGRVDLSDFLATMERRMYVTERLGRFYRFFAMLDSQGSGKVTVDAICDTLSSHVSLHASSLPCPSREDLVHLFGADTITFEHFVHCVLEAVKPQVE